MLSRPSVVLGLLFTAVGLFLVARSSPFAGAIAGTVVLVALLWGVQ
jgi:hypothetical protein